MGRNKWNKNRGRDDQNRPSSLQPVWKVRKVVGPRDMDAMDDDVNYTRLAKRASPPPAPAPDPPPETKFKPVVKLEGKPVVKQEGKPRPEDIAIFNHINQSAYWNQSPAPGTIPGLTSSSETSNHPDIKPSWPPICGQQTDDLQLAVGVVKQETPEDEPQCPKYNIPDLDLVNTDDEEEFLYGD